MERIINWFTPDRRNRLYGVLTVVLALCTTHGLLTAEDAAQVLLALGYALGVGGLTLAKRNINHDE